MKPTEDMTIEQLLTELNDMPNRKRELLDALEESGGAAGSPMESLYERWDDLEIELKRREYKP